MKSIPIPSKFDSVATMFAKCTGHVNKKNVDITAPQSKRSVNKARVDVRVGMIL